MRRTSATSEGTVVEVTMDDAFSVTGVEELPGRGGARLAVMAARTARDGQGAR